MGTRSPQKCLYTVNGDTANTAARLEGLTKQLGASILISDSVARRLPASHPFLLRPLGTYRLKGKDTPVEVADVMGEDDGSRFAQAIKREIDCADEALACFYRRDFPKAQTAFTTLAREARATGNTIRAEGYKFLAAKARQYGKASHQRPWDCTITMKEK